MKHLLLFMIFLITSPAIAAEFGDYYGAEYVKNYDGDTVTFNLPDLHPVIGNKISIRVDGIDTPEIRGKCEYEKELAVQAKNLVKEMLSEAENIDLINLRRGKYFRIVADIVADGVMVKDSLLREGLAVEYNGGRKTNSWCQ